MRTDGEEYSLRHSPRRRALPCIAEGFSPTARDADRIYFAISISPPSPHAGGDARAPRPHVVQSFLPIALSGENAVAPQGLPRAQEGLQPARAPARQPRRGFPVLKGFSPHAQRCARAGGLRLGESE